MAAIEFNEIVIAAGAKRRDPLFLVVHPI